MANNFYIVPNVRAKSAKIKESSGTEFLCPRNTVMTGRWHEGDENGETQYEYATLKAIDENGNEVKAQIDVTDIQWSDSIIESSGYGYIATANRVIVGRMHTGDENGYTKYATAIVKANGVLATVIDPRNSASFKESSGVWFVTDAQRIIIGRVHSGDENGLTYFVTARLVINADSQKPAPEGTRIVIAERFSSPEFKESISLFQCPSNTVITGRNHSGDENGKTIYQYSTLKAVDVNGNPIAGFITVEDVIWTKAENESSGKGFIAPVNRVIVGRKHFGDENAISEYATGVVKFNGHPTYISDYSVSQLTIESSSSFSVRNNEVITAQYHYGDENGFTYYGFGSIYCQKQIPNEFPFDLIVTFHTEENYFPMSATDFAILSRFREHIPNGTDSGYNKQTGRFETGNSHALNFYGIPFNVINGYYSKISHYRLFNLRPRDPNALAEFFPKEYSVFLQPFMHLYGVREPNGIVPVYIVKDEFTDVDGSKKIMYDFWLFFGYNDVIALSHEGDWEHLIVEVKDSKIEGAWLSSHTSLNHHESPLFRSATKLEIKDFNGRQQLTIYCSKGTHALYATVAEATYPDKTNYGYQWRVTDNAQTLSEQPWYLFAGAWGEVGSLKESTGPLGPWYKRFNFWWEAKVSLSTFAEPNEIVIVPDQVFLSGYQDEKNSKFEAPEGMVITGRKHIGDENGASFCLYATLKAIDGNGNAMRGVITFEDASWSEWITESSSDYIAPSGHVIVGREHIGDENGMTRYKISRILFKGKSTTTTRVNSKFEFQYYRESAGVFFKTEPFLIFIGRKHMGDENQMTENYKGILKSMLTIG